MHAAIIPRRQFPCFSCRAACRDEYSDFFRQHRIAGAKKNVNKRRLAVQIANLFRFLRFALACARKRIFGLEHCAQIEKRAKHRIARQMSVDVTPENVAEKVVQKARMAAFNLERLARIEANRRRRLFAIKNRIRNLAECKLLGSLVTLSVIFDRVGGELVESVFQLWMVRKTKILVEIVNRKLEKNSQRLADGNTRVGRIAAQIPAKFELCTVDLFLDLLCLALNDIKKVEKKVDSYTYALKEKNPSENRGREETMLLR